jgi:hypothetical protein
VSIISKKFAQLYESNVLLLFYFHYILVGPLKLKLHLFDLLWICCGYVVQLFDLLWISRKPYSAASICCGFVVESTTNPQHLDTSRCCEFVVDLLWICCTTCCTTNPQQCTTNPQQIEQVKFELMARKPWCAAPPVWPPARQWSYSIYTTIFRPAYVI